jgi:peptidoglycan hydrolase-like protein with peptidoglycan-binding domain
LPPSKSPAKAPEPSFTPPSFHKPIPDPQRVVTTPLLKQGDRGVDVRTVQNALNRVLIGKNPLLKTDGIFGLHVAQAVKRVQQHENLLCDGTVGMQTRRALDLILV